ncbi:DNA polymerase beta-like [Achroia grisella]|uniref:DNA polymerase beta-like n=1 Tax=Achroia grisella TaxID=688607 RepID=UPI0027D29A81|nr:DNA polymerase beta-like [Achroia grisella]
MSKRKNPSYNGNVNAAFCNFLIELSEYEKNVSRNIHKYNAYRKAATVLATHQKRIESGEEARKLNGIGDKISKKIDEFLHTGKLKKLENIHQDEEAQAVSLLTRVSGIGPVKAAELVRAGLKSIEHLRKYQDKLNHHQIIGLRHFEDFEKKIPRSEIKKVEEVIMKQITSIDAEFTITVCGSYRRGKENCGDIDVLVTHPLVKVVEEKKKPKDQILKKLIDKLNSSLITDTISMGDTKFMGVCRLTNKLPYRRLDIRLIPCVQYYCAVLYFTGSDVFNKNMRAHALEQGFTLNEYSLRPIGVTGVPGEPVPITSEEEIFEYINYPYKKPEERNL